MVVCQHLAHARRGAVPPETQAPAVGYLWVLALLLVVPVPAEIDDATDHAGEGGSKHVVCEPLPALLGGGYVCGSRELALPTPAACACGRILLHCLQRGFLVRTGLFVRKSRWDTLGKVGKLRERDLLFRHLGGLVGSWFDGFRRLGLDSLWLFWGDLGGF